MGAAKIDVLEEVRELLSKPKGFFQWLYDELRYFFRAVLSSADRFYWDNGFSKAASLAYTTLLSLVPAITLVFGIFSSFAVSNQYVADVRKFIFKQFVPDLQTVDTVIEYLTVFSQSISSLNALVISFLVLTCILLLNSIEYALNEVWQVHEPRSIAHRVQIFCAIILIFPALLISGTYFFASLQVEPYLNFLPTSRFWEVAYRALFPFLIDFSAFTLLYYLVPKAPVRFRSAVFGAVIAAALFGIAKSVFAAYIERFSSYSTVYGTVAGIPIFLFWLYCAWTIVLFGAECSYQAQYLPRTGKLFKRGVMSIGDGRLLLVVQALVMIARAFNEGRKPPSDLEICEALGCSSVVLKPALDALESDGIVSRGDSRDAPLTFLRAPDKIKLVDLREALFKSGRAIYYPEQVSKVFGLFVRNDEIQNKTLADIL